MMSSIKVREAILCHPQEKRGYWIWRISVVKSEIVLRSSSSLSMNYRTRGGTAAKPVFTNISCEDNAKATAISHLRYMMVR